MNVYKCACGGMLFFDNSQCLNCRREVGWCPNCAAIRPVEPDGDDLALRCTACQSRLAKCRNYAVEHVCNRFIPADVQPSGGGQLCRSCTFTKNIPDLSIAGNRERWYRLEQGKRRLLYALDYLRLPYGGEGEGVNPPLSFRFQADPGAEHRNWHPVHGEQQINTGHVAGVITINLREAEPAEREKLRVDFQEAHRTIIGHFRHEIAHYYWDMLVRGRCEEEFKSVFGDHNNPSYADAMQRYYNHGPPADWASGYISAYATMHPWEDFAETFASYLDLVSVLETAGNMRLGVEVDPRRCELPAMLDRYQRIGLVINEINRDMGLKDLVPEVFVPTVVAKIEFVHYLVRRNICP